MFILKKLQEKNLFQLIAFPNDDIMPQLNIPPVWDSLILPEPPLVTRNPISDGRICKSQERVAVRHTEAVLHYGAVGKHLSNEAQTF